MVEGQFLEMPDNSYGGKQTIINRLGAIQIMCDTSGEGGGGVKKMSPNVTRGRGEGVSQCVTLQFLLAISLVKVNEGPCYVTQGG